MTIDELEQTLNRQQKEERRLVNQNSGYPRNGYRKGRYQICS
jgi:hypothetical protein